ncbi:hypothetical protein A2U01_0074554, partial [Trifolium medium]|nr:hypothetical protein [Trifolium medium]
ANSIDYDSWDIMSGARRGPGRHVEKEAGSEIDPGASMWV